MPQNGDHYGSKGKKYRKKTPKPVKTNLSL